MLDPTIMPANQPLDYEGWKVYMSKDGNSASAQRKINGQVIEVPLKHSSLSIPFEGWYGEEPSFATYAIGGICILCGCFGLHLEGMDQRTTASSFLSPSNHGNWQLIERYVQEEGHIIVAAYIPTELCRYHTILVPVQAEIAKQKSVKEMVYHVPRKEYHFHHGKIEQLDRRSLPGLHRLLDQYTDRLEHFIRETFSRAGVNVRIIDPFEEGMDPIDAYRFPYLNLQYFGMDSQSIIAIEDFAEVRIAIETRAEIPVWTGVLGFPSPYRQRGVAQTRWYSLDSLAN